MPYLLLAALLAGYSYREALPGPIYHFPRDHFEHPDYRTEWWYYTGNLQDEAQKRYGFELVFFRQGMHQVERKGESAWRIDDLYLAHAAVTEISEGQFHSAERLNRAGPGIAGASFAEQRIWNGNWESQWGQGLHKLSAVAEDFRFNLTLEAAKPFVINGVNGISQKAEGAGRASHYVTFPRLNVTGSLDGRAVHGEAWMDHEWFTEQLASEQSGWDWFSVQFDDQTELMLFDLRRKDGAVDRFSAGTFIDRAGNGRHLTVHDFEVHPSEYWASPKTGTRYPVGWRIRVPSLRIDIFCRAAIPNQELVSGKGGPAYWEGAVVYSGSHSGRGYLEMTGYDKPVSFR